MDLLIYRVAGGRPDSKAALHISRVGGLHRRRLQTRAAWRSQPRSEWGRRRRGAIDQVIAAEAIGSHRLLPPGGLHPLREGFVSSRGCVKRRGEVVSSSSRAFRVEPHSPQPLPPVAPLFLSFIFPPMSDLGEANAPFCSPRLFSACFGPVVDIHLVAFAPLNVINSILDWHCTSELRTSPTALLCGDSEHQHVLHASEDSRARGGGWP